MPKYTDAPTLISSKSHGLEDHRRFECRAATKDVGAKIYILSVQVRRVRLQASRRNLERSQADRELLVLGGASPFVASPFHNLSFSNNLLENLGPVNI
jgi:hypothetical protein